MARLAHSPLLCFRFLQRLLSAGKVFQAWKLPAEYPAFIALFTVSGTLVYVVLHGGFDPYGVYERYLLTGSFQWSGFLNSMREIHLLFTIGAVLYYLHVGKVRAVEEKLAEAERRLQVEQERRQYEYSALASQVSPHLLANIFHSWSHKLRAKMPEMARQVAETYQLMTFYIKAQEPDGP